MEKTLPAHTTVASTTGRAPMRHTGQVALLSPTDHFVERHLGPNPAEVDEMLTRLKTAIDASYDALSDQGLIAS